MKITDVHVVVGYSTRHEQTSASTSALLERPCEAPFQLGADPRVSV
jgi:hypothetical protein